MKLRTYIYFDSDGKKVNFLNKLVHDKGEKIGKVSKTYIEDGKMWIEITIDSKKVKKIRKKLGL